jgi:riboflavin-specific deaminase-like protein
MTKFGNIDRVKPRSTGPASAVTPGSEWATEAAWTIVLAAAQNAARLELRNEPALFAVDSGGGRLQPADVAGAKTALAWDPGKGWRLTLPRDDPRRALVDLYLPVCSASPSRPITVGHLGQSLDGFIATHAGESQFVTGEENIRHLHRMRALCDAVIVGAGTVAADDPQLTTRHVPGPSPLRVVLDPAQRLAEHYRVFSDEVADTLYVCTRGQGAQAPGESHGRATVLEVDGDEAGMDVTEVLRVLRGRGCHRIFVEGGGVTVSTFLGANLLDRLQMAIAPLIIGDGRPAIRLPAPVALRDCHRPRYRVFRMGGDVLFDCELRAHGDDQASSGVERII